MLPPPEGPIHTMNSYFQGLLGMLVPEQHDAFFSAPKGRGAVPAARRAPADLEGQVADRPPPARYNCNEPLADESGGGRRRFAARCRAGAARHGVQWRRKPRAAQILAIIALVQFHRQRLDHRRRCRNQVLLRLK